MGPSKPWTAGEKRWRELCYEFGCVCCAMDGNAGVQGQYHHIVEGGRRKGHSFGFVLCSPGHHQPDSRSGKIAIHPGVNKAWVERYGTQMRVLGWLEEHMSIGP